MQQIRFAKLIKQDPLFRKWLAKPPRLSVHTGANPWRLFIQRDEDGGWAYRDYPRYNDAYETLAKYLPKVHDMALNCKPQGFPPPRLKHDGERTWWPRPSYHEWCPFCRRPVLIVKRRKHPLMPQLKHSEPIRMCGICGAREEFIKMTMKNEFRSTLQWPIEK